jgi:hypothetical protein
MSPRRNGDDHPLLVSILGVISLPIMAGIAVGVVGALGAGAAVTFAGLDGGNGGPVAKQTLYMPSYSPTTPTTSPMAVAPSQTLTAKKNKAAASPSAGATKQAPSATKINLVANPTSVSRKERIGLSGTYRGGNGHVLQVQIIQGNKWRDFPVTVNVQSGKFSTWVITNQTGSAQFRVVDSSNQVASNSVTITIN